MNQAQTSLPGLQVTVTAHEDQESRLVLVTLEALSAAADEDTRQPISAALVIDRSGSMHGQDLNLAKKAARDFIKSLSPEDRVAVVAYDDHVNLVSGLAAPSEAVRSAIQKIDSGGSTNLYGGWLEGAKQLSPGGRVILLSDGLANAGRFTSADQLARQAGITWSRFGVSTTTIGIGSDYDEEVMSAMAHKGGGSHYFAKDSSVVERAFRDERHQLGSRSVSNATLRLGSTTLVVGDLFHGEVKRRVFRAQDLAGPLTLRATLPGQSEPSINTLQLPARFGFSDEGRLEGLLDEAASIQRQMSGVTDSASAAATRDRLRSVILRLLQHPSADEPGTKAVVADLQECMQRLESLTVRYEEHTAMLNRKASYQAAHNLAEPARAFDYDYGKEESIRAVMTRSVSGFRGDFKPDPAGFLLAPVEVWIKWKALPIKVTRAKVIVVMDDFKDSYRTAEIERTVGRRVETEPGYFAPDEIIRLLSEHRS